MEINLLTFAIMISVSCSMFYYWATAKNHNLKTAYKVVTFNGILLSWVNWALAAPGRVPNFSWAEIRWGSETYATNFFTVLCLWMIVSGVRGLLRLKYEENNVY